MNRPEAEAGPETGQAQPDTHQPGAQELLDQKNVPLDGQEEQYWLSVDRAYFDDRSPESGLVAASYNYVGNKLEGGQQIEIPSGQQLDSHVQVALGRVREALNDPEMVRNAIYDPSERRPEDTGALRVEEIADYLESFKANSDGNDTDQDLQRASLDIALGMVTAQFAETHADATSREVEDYRPDAAELAAYLQDRENITRHETTFIESTKARVEDLEYIRQHPAEARESIAKGLGGSAEPNVDHRTRDERVQDARESLDDALQHGTSPDNVVSLDDRRRTPEASESDALPAEEQNRAELDHSPNGTEVQITDDEIQRLNEEASKIPGEIAKVDLALDGLRGNLRDLQVKADRLQVKRVKAERSGGDTSSLDDQITENNAARRDFDRQYRDLGRYKQLRIDRLAEIQRRTERAEANGEDTERPDRQSVEVGAETQARLDEIAEATPEADVELLDRYGILQIDLPYGIHVTADVDDDYAEIRGIMIPEEVKELRGHGIGERLLRTMAAALADRGVKTVDGNFQSKGGLATRGKVFGKDNIDFYYRSGVQPQGLDYDRAMGMLGDFQEGGRNMRIRGRSDLTKVDTSAFERAVFGTRRRKQAA